MSEGAYPLRGIIQLFGITPDNIDRDLKVKMNSVADEALADLERTGHMECLGIEDGMACSLSVYKFTAKGKEEACLLLL